MKNYSGENFFLFSFKLQLIEDVTLFSAKVSTGDDHGVVGDPVHIPAAATRQEFAAEFAVAAKSPCGVV